MVDMTSMAHLAGLPPNLDDSVSGTPARRPGSARRTSTIDMLWPGGHGGPLELVGRARDLLTPAGGPPTVVGEATMLVTIPGSRTVGAISVTPATAGIQGLVGAVGGSDLRNAIERVLPGEREAATPLHFLLDDIAGTSLIAGFAWSRWDPEIRQRMSGGAADRGSMARTFGVRKGRIICSGLRPGGWADTHRVRQEDPRHAVRPAGDIATPDDPLGWHQFPPDPKVGMRRHRRVDAWLEDGVVKVDAFFRDACWDPDGTQLALHEYTVTADVDRHDHTLLSAVTTPRVLPFPECQWAAPHVEKLKGIPVSSFRTTVQQTLTELHSCTHLNDMLRSLAEVPALMKAL
jgi:Protein of unknown function (DUF2889)